MYSHLRNRWNKPWGFSGQSVKSTRLRWIGIQPHATPRQGCCSPKKIREYAEIDVVKDSLEKIRKTVNFSPDEMDAPGKV